MLKRWGLRVAGACLLPIVVVAATAFADGTSARPAPSTSSSASAKPAPAAKWSDADGFPAVSSDDPTWGARAAPVTIVVFSDFECRFCAALSGTLDDLKRKYGPQKLRVVHKNNPLVDMHKNARTAAIAGEVVYRLGGGGAFWTFHARTFADQKNIDDSHLVLFSKEAGIDPASITKEVVKLATKKVDDDLAQGKSAGVRGTPTSFINGIRTAGAQSAEKFSAVIDQQLEAAAALKGKVKPDRVYVTLSKKMKPASP